MRAPSYSPREQEVLQRPEGYVIKVLSNRQWITLPVSFDADEALAMLIRLRENNYRALVYAHRRIDGETRLACVTEQALKR